MNRYLTKVATILTQENKKDLLNTGVIAGLGGVGTVLAHKAFQYAPAKMRSTGGLFALGTGIGLAADYAGIRINKHLNKHIDGTANSGAVSTSNKAALL